MADTISDTLYLAPWVMKVTIGLLAVGFFVVLATSWVQSLPSTTAAEEAGEVPSDWQVAPRDALETLRRGRLPHLTWRRAAVAGVVAFWFFFGLVGLIALVRRGGRRGHRSRSG